VEFLDGEVRVADGYVLVCNESVPDKLRARKILAAVDQALKQAGLRAVMFDTRDMPAPTEEVNEVLRHWVDACRLHDKVALLVKSDLKRIASNMRALSVKVKLRSFHDIGEAEAWLRAPVPKPRTRSAPAPVAAPSAPPPERPWAGGAGARERSRQEPRKKEPSDKPPLGRWKSALLQGLNNPSDD
jgi:hypothetical protein